MLLLLVTFGWLWWWLYIEWNRITCLSLLLLLLVIVLCILMMGHYEKFERNSDTGSLVLLSTILNWVPQFIMMSPLKGYELAVRIIISDVWYHFRFWNWNEMTSQDCNLFSLSIHFLEGFWVRSWSVTERAKIGFFSGKQKKKKTFCLLITSFHQRNLLPWLQNQSQLIFLSVQVEWLFPKPLFRQAKTK